MAKVLVIGALALAAVPLLAPLVVRGAALSWLVARATSGLCGVVRVGGGAIGWTAVPRWLLGKPIEVRFDDVRVLGPDGSETLRAGRVVASVEIHREPWRVVVVQASVRDGAWRLAVPRPGVMAGFLQAWVPASVAGGRAACASLGRARSSLGRRAGAGASPPAPGAPPRLELVVRSLRLDGVDVDLSFPSWGLSLSRVSVGGSLVARAGSAPPNVLFDAQDGVAAGGVLRVGLQGSPRATRARFDRVVIPRVAVVPEAPSDLLMEIAEARTGPARLSGRAVFHEVFPLVLPALPPGLTLRASWQNVGAAVAAFDAPWWPARLNPKGFEGSVDAELDGPYQALSGTVRISGPRLGLRAALVRSRSFEGSLELDGVDTSAVLDPALVPSFGGRLAGQLRVALQMGPAPGDVTGELTHADLHLDRARKGPWPRHLVVRVGPEARGAVPVGALVVSARGARLAGHSLRLEHLSAAWAGAQARGAVAVTFRRSPSTDARADVPRARPVFDARLQVAIPALERLIPQAGVGGQLTFSATARGPADRLEVVLVFPSGSGFRLGPNRFVLPRGLRLSVSGGDQLLVPPFTLRREGGGSVQARGRAVLDGPIAADLALRDYPVRALPGLGAMRVPGALVGGEGGTFAALVSGQLDGPVRVRGALAAPQVTATLSIERLALGGRRLPDGTLRLRSRSPRALAFEANLGAALSVRGLARADGHAGVSGAFTVKDFPLGPWLPRPLTGLTLGASGEGRFEVPSGGPTALDARLRLLGPGADLNVEGELRAERKTAALSGTIDLARLGPRRLPGLSSARGTVAVALSTAPGLDPAWPVRGHALARDTVSLRPSGWHVPVEIGAGARVEIDGRRLHTRDLQAAVSGVRGRLSGDLHLAPGELRRSSLDLTAEARVQPPMAPWLDRYIAKATGFVDVTARLTGTFARPAVDGDAYTDGLTLVPAGRGEQPVVRVAGGVHAQDNRLSTRGLHLKTGRAGNVTVGREEHAASVEVSSWRPLRLGRVDLPISARHVTLGDSKTPFEVRDLAADVTVSGDPDTHLLISGEVNVGRVSLDPKRGPRGRGGRKPRPWYAALPPTWALDLRVRSTAQAIDVAVPNLPDVTLGLECHLIATSRGATATGRLRGDGPYSRLALTLYDWLTPGRLRECQLGTE